jgi:hypothetical protein
MSLTTVAASLPELPDPGLMFAQVEIELGIPGGSFDQWPRALQRFYAFMWPATGFGTEEIRYTTRQIAQACGRCERWVYKALRQALDRMRGEEGHREKAPLITKRFVKGPRDVAGRLLGLVVNFAKPKVEEETARPKGKAKAVAAAPATAPVPSAPPEPHDPEAARRAAGWIRALIGKNTVPAPGAEKTEAELTAEADRKKAAYYATVERRKADRARAEAKDPEAPTPHPRE